MGLRAIVCNYTAGQVLDGVFGSRMGRRWYLAALCGGTAPALPELDVRSMWARWLVQGGISFASGDLVPPALPDLAAASSLRRWLWVWTGW